MLKLRELKLLWEHFAYSKTVYQLHSPLLFGWHQSMATPSDLETDTEELWKYHKSILNSRTPIVAGTFGAGSRSGDKRHTLGQIARNSGSGRKKILKIARLVLSQRANNVLELGTNVGLLATSLAKMMPRIDFDTIEAHAPYVQIATKAKNKWGLHNLNIHQKTFAEYWKELEHDRKFDVIFIDGDHNGPSLEANVKEALIHLNDSGIIILDDIHWSVGMSVAWKKIRNWDDIGTSYCDWQIGILSKEDTGQHVDVVPAWQKPWLLF